MLRFAFLLIAFSLNLICFAMSPALGETYFVAPDGSGDFPTIDAAVQATVDGDVIELGDGTFTGAGNRDIMIVQKSITVRSRSGDASLCVIDCQGSASEHHTGFLFNDFSPDVVAHLERVTIRNGFSRSGGAIVTGQFARPTLEGCLLVGNTAEFAGGAVGGDGGIDLIHCTLVGNSCGAYGGSAIYLEDFGGLGVQNTIIAFGSGGPAVEYAATGAIDFSCCDISNNDGGDWVGSIASFFGHDGNISADPLFCDRENGDFRLQEDSPCAPFNPQNPTCDLAGAFPVGCPTTPVERMSWGQIRVRFAR